MVRQYKRKTVEKGQASKYYRVARSLYRAADDLDTLAEERDTYGNAIGIIVVHSAIAYADALCIAYGGFKSTSGDHLRAVDALKDALGRRVEANRLKNLNRILKEKDSISCQGTYYALEDARVLIARLGEFRNLAERLFMERPT